MMYYKIFLILPVWNVLVFLLYGLDKLFAKLQKRRISEAALLGTSFGMGALGAMFGMVVFNHKTKKLRFRLSIPLFVILQGILIWFLTFEILF